MRAHDCRFDEVEIERADEDENLRAGMRVLIPCRECGDTPHDHMARLEAEVDAATRALVAVDPRRALFHWSPAPRRKQIVRHGLRPGMRPSTSVGPYWAPVCLADSPTWAWALSGGMRWTPAGEWDLWETWLDLVEEPIILASEDRASGIYEVRTMSRIPKRHLRLVGHRVKP